MVIATLIAFALSLFGIPLFLVLGGLAVVLFYLNGDPLEVVFIEYFRLTATSTLVAIPLFTLAGFMLARSSSPARFVRFATALYGSLPGSLAIVGIVTCALFTAFTGASGVTIIALGGLLYPVLREHKYGEQFSLGLLTTCGSVGLMFPPSLPLILYGIVAGVNIDQLFLAGLLPGLLIIVLLSLYAMWQAKRHQIKTIPFSWHELWASIKHARWELPVPIFILAGIYSGSITAEEAAACVCIYTFFVACILRRELSLTKDMPGIAKESMVLVGSILMILGCALALTGFLVNEEVPDKILAAIRGMVDSRLEFLLWLNLFLLVIGCLMDVFSAIVIVLPLIIPIAAEYQVHPVHLAMIFLTNLEIGYSTPPVGLNLFVASFRFKKPILTLYRASVPYLILLLIALILITYVPDLSLWLIR
jgi:C4-dicarboxylate transporter DctM subunit